MRFMSSIGLPFYGRQLKERTLSAWRAAAELVWARWEAVRNAAPERREHAFVAYLAALDAEAEAAAALAELHLTRAA